VQRWEYITVTGAAAWLLAGGNRLFEIMLGQITLASMCALMGSIFYVATLLMRTMVPLRISNMISNVFFMAFDALAGDIKTFLTWIAE
jgi:hypothetical protein